MRDSSDMTDHEEFTRRHFFAGGNVLRFRSGAVMDRVRTGFAAPVKND